MSNTTERDDGVESESDEEDEGCKKLAEASENFNKQMEDASDTEQALNNLLSQTDDQDLNNYAQVYNSFVHVAKKKTATSAGTPKLLGAVPPTSSGSTLVISNGQAAWRPASDSDLDDARDMYRWDEGSVKTKPPHVKDVPEQDDVTTAAPFGHTLFSLPKLTKVLLALAGYHLPELRRRTLKRYEKYTEDTPKPTDNNYFVQQRLFGANACAIRKITDAVFDDVNTALKSSGEHQLTRNDGEVLYMIDYSLLQEFSEAIMDHGKYVPASVLVLSYKNNTFEAEAILYDRAGRYEGAVRCGASNKWEFGKMCVRVADWNMHELGSHLTLTHLVVEVALVNAHRCLPKSHPMLQLLLPHFYNTLPLNANAREVLVPDIIAEKLTPWTLSQCSAINSKIFNTWNFKDNYAPKNLTDRGVADLPATDYPFGAAAAIAWKHISEYVRGAIKKMADGAAGNSILDDVYIKLFCESMRDSETGLPGFPVITDEEELCQALTMIIYTASYQHSAVNYFQDQFMGYVPNAPSCLAKAPSSNLDDLSEDVYLEALPAPRTAKIASFTLDMLSDHPEDDHRLVEFASNDGVPEHVQWLPLETLREDMQTALKAELVQLSANVGSEVPALVTVHTLAQSVLI